MATRWVLMDPLNTKGAAKTAAPSSTDAPKRAPYFCIPVVSVPAPQLQAPVIVYLLGGEDDGSTTAALGVGVLNNFFCLFLLLAKGCVDWA